MKCVNNCLVVGLLTLAGTAAAGPLEPSGPPQPTGRTTGQIEPRVPLAVSADTVDPIVITTPGSYYLTGDITAFPSNPALLITASNVTLDLNGFTVRGNLEVMDGHGVHITGDNVVLKNGFVFAVDGHGVFCEGAGNRVEDIAVSLATQAGVRCDEAIVRGIQAHDNGDDGIRCVYCTVENVLVKDNGDNGVNVIGGAVRGATAIANEGIGILCNDGIVHGSSSLQNVQSNSGGSCMRYDSHAP